MRRHLLQERRIHSSLKRANRYEREHTRKYVCTFLTQPQDIVSVVRLWKHRLGGLR